MKYIRLFGRDYAIFWRWPFIQRMVTPNVQSIEQDITTFLAPLKDIKGIYPAITTQDGKIFIETPPTIINSQYQLLKTYGKPMKNQQKIHKIGTYSLVVERAFHKRQVVGSIPTAPIKVKGII